ncbi:MAG: hypothetical protein R3313_00745 [Candidatus Saccharimonadales bacterium]|nr:hypothetical protein [Candidatus Saccharimonadales bacterium]
MIHGQKGFGAIEIILIVVILGVAGFLGYRTYKTTTESEDEVSATCNVENEVEYCLTADKDSASSSEYIQLTSRITNRGNTDVNETFPCVDNDPAILINSEYAPHSGFCLTAVSEVNIAPGKTKEYTYRLTAALLGLGENQVSAEWADYKSNEVTLTRTEDTEEDREVLNRCLEGEMHGGCETISVEVDGNYEEHTCEYYESLYSPIGIKPVDWFCEDGSVGLGFIYFYVPRDDAELWRAKLREVPEFRVYDD